MKALLIADSPDFDFEFIADHAQDFDHLIVTDGAALKLPPGVLPHIICGDFDSLNVEHARKLYPQSEFVQLPDQNANDLEKALLLALSRGVKDITITSACGGRQDVALANLSVMIRHHTTCELSMVRGALMTKVLSDREQRVASTTFEARPGSVVSCIALERDAIVSLINVRWEMHEGTLRSGSHGVSNEALGGPVTVHVHCGLVVVRYEIPVS